MCYTYVLHSLKDGEFYTGFTNNLERRIAEHNSKGQFSTKCRIPFRLVYYEGCLSKGDAIAREEYLKSGRGKRYIRDRIKNYLSEGMPTVSGACPVPDF